MQNNLSNDDKIRISLRQIAAAARTPYETGFVSAQYKKELVELKWFIEDLLEEIGYFAGEEEWEKERMLQVLTKQNGKG